MRGPRPMNFGEWTDAYLPPKETPATTGGIFDDGARKHPDRPTSTGPILWFEGVIEPADIGAAASMPVPVRAVQMFHLLAAAFLFFDPFGLAIQSGFRERLFDPGYLKFVLPTVSYLVVVGCSLHFLYHPRRFARRVLAKHPERVGPTAGWFDADGWYVVDQATNRAGCLNYAGTTRVRTRNGVLTFGAHSRAGQTIYLPSRLFDDPDAVRLASQIEQWRRASITKESRPRRWTPPIDASDNELVKDQNAAKTINLDLKRIDADWPEMQAIARHHRRWSQFFGFGMVVGFIPMLVSASLTITVAGWAILLMSIGLNVWNERLRGKLPASAPVVGNLRLRLTPSGFIERYLHEQHAHAWADVRAERVSDPDGAGRTVFHLREDRRVEIRDDELTREQRSRILDWTSKDAGPPGSDI